jgi:hypothetical protein
MTPFECAREADVIDAVTSGDWHEELTDHVARCAVCADLATVTRALSIERRAADDEVRVPASGLVWWRMQIRARHDATRTAARPIAMAQAIAAACGLVLASALFTVIRPWLQEWMPWSKAMTNAIHDTMGAWISGLTVNWAIPLALALAVWLVLAPLAIYLVISED